MLKSPPTFTPLPGKLSGGLKKSLLAVGGLFLIWLAAFFYTLGHLPATTQECQAVFRANDNRLPASYALFPLTLGWRADIPQTCERWSE